MTTVKGKTFILRALCLAGVLSLGIRANRLAQAGEREEIFVPSSRCQVCHNKLRDGTGNDLSMGVQWRSTVMAHAALDPYWQASVRRETADHPTAAAAIEDKCATCHMPMSRFTAVHSGGKGVVLANLPDERGRTGTAHGALALEGVSCSVCHRISGRNLGSPESFTGGYLIDTSTNGVFGPFDVENGVARVMESASGFRPGKAEHIRKAALCGTCHTLYTHALDATGAVSGELAEQMPYLEWLHSDYADTMSCQDCHMPDVGEDVAISSVLGVQREGVRKHQFRGGNALLLAMLGKHGMELGARTAASELENSRRATVGFMQKEAAEIDLAFEAAAGGATLKTTVSIENLAGHKLPTAYPSRRVWVHFKVDGGDGRSLFESGVPEEDGSVAGNDNDRDGSRFEPHYSVITNAGQVQIYEAILGTPDGHVTTGLLKADRYLKDNRIVPAGFNKESAGKDIAVAGNARHDADFKDGSDAVAYVVPTEDQDVVTVTVELLYQAIGYRWAMNLDGYRAREPERFVRMYSAMESRSKTIVLAGKQMTVRLSELGMKE